LLRLPKKLKLPRNTPRKNKSKPMLMLRPSMKLKKPRKLKMF